MKQNLNLNKQQVDLYATVFQILESIQNLYPARKSATTEKENTQLLLQLESHILELQSQKVWNPFLDISSVAQQSGQTTLEFCKTHKLLAWATKHFSAALSNKEDFCECTPEVSMPALVICSSWPSGFEKPNTQKFLAQIDALLDTYIKYGFDINQVYQCDLTHEQRTFALQVSRTWAEQEVFDWINKKGANWNSQVLVSEKYQHYLSTHKALKRRVSEIYSMNRHSKKTYRFLDFLQTFNPIEAEKQWLSEKLQNKNLDTLPNRNTNFKI